MKTQPNTSTPGLTLNLPRHLLSFVWQRTPGRPWPLVANQKRKKWRGGRVGKAWWEYINDDIIILFPLYFTVWFPCLCLSLVYLSYLGSNGLAVFPLLILWSLPLLFLFLLFLSLYPSQPIQPFSLAFPFGFRRQRRRTRKAKEARKVGGKRKDR